MTTYNFDEYISDVTRVITENQRIIEAKVQENTHLLKQLAEAIKDKKEVKTLQTPVTSSTKLQTFSSKLATMPSTSTITSSLSMCDKLKYAPETLEAFEKITKFYDYKSSQEIIRNGKHSRYPRYLCSEKANPEIVRKLFTYGFIDKILVDQTLYSIAKLPRILVDSTEKIINKYGIGIYGIQVFDAATDLLGKPIVLCQIFKTGKNSNITGVNTDLKLPQPCTIDKFQEWISTKRAFGLITLKSKLEDMIRLRKSTILGMSKGGEVEEMITLFYERESLLTKDTTALEGMYDRVINLKHKHAKETLQQYQMITEPIVESVISGPSIKITTPTKRMIKEDDSSDPFWGH